MSIPWTDEQTEALRQLDQRLTLAELTEQWNAIAEQRGWPLRTLRGIRARRARIGIALKTRPWTARELEHLDDLVGDRPMELVVRAYNCWATTNGFPHRTLHAIRHQVERQGLETHAQGSWVHAGTLERMLQKSSKAISLWVKKGWVRRQGNNWQSAIRRVDLQRLARQKPHLFGGLPWDDLFWVLEDAELTDRICAEYPRRCHGPGITLRVECVTTGRVYSSVREAAAANHVAPNSISTALRRGRPVCGLVFRCVEPRKSAA